MGLSRGGLASSLSIHLQLQFKRRSFGLCLQRWYASPSKCKHKARLRLTERGLTIPSSGRAFGTPLKSNVRRRKLVTSTSLLRTEWRALANDDRTQQGERPRVLC